jgi:TatD DNase family protein
VNLIDTHCHLNFDSYDQDRDAVVARAAEAGVTRIIVPATDLDTSREGIDLAAQYCGVFAAVGIHPNSTANFALTDVDSVAEWSQSPNVIAIGEIGLDYYRDRSPKAVQRQAFEAQLALASRLGLPVIIHNRDASEDLMTTLESWARDLPDALRDRPGVLHSFSAPQSIAERALAAGFYLGFTGPITFKNADDLRHTAAMTPLDRLLVETDGPFLTPAPLRGQRNEPAYVRIIAERLASIKQVNLEALAKATTDNAVRLFSLPA